MMSSIVSVSMEIESSCQHHMDPAKMWKRDGIWYTEGVEGKRYSVTVRNRSSKRIEAVVSVDGLDVHDGEVASTSKRGLIIPAYSSFSFEGFRTSLSDVATFRFSKSGGSYAGLSGKPENIGVIGVAIFEEKMYNAIKYWKNTNWDQNGWWYQPSPFIGGNCTRTTNNTRSMEVNVNYSATPMSAMPQASAGQSLGTEFGEQRHSQVGETTFTRATSSPHSQFTVRYEDRETLRSMGFPIDGPVIPGHNMPNAFPADSRFCKPPTLAAV